MEYRFADLVINRTYLIYYRNIYLRRKNLHPINPINKISLRPY